MLLGSLSRHNKDLEWRTLKPTRWITALRSWTDRVTALREISVTGIFYLEDSRKIRQGMRAHRSKDAKRRSPHRAGERERERALWVLFICFFFPWACPMQIGFRQERCSTWSPHWVLRPSFDLALFYFRGRFPSLSFRHCHFWTPFPFSNYLTVCYFLPCFHILYDMSFRPLIIFVLMNFVKA